jgi:hypothetical protein
VTKAKRILEGRVTCKRVDATTTRTTYENELHTRAPYVVTITVHGTPPRPVGVPADKLPKVGKTIVIRSYHQRGA